MGLGLDLEERREREGSAVRLLASLAKWSERFQGTLLELGAGLKKKKNEWDVFLTTKPLNHTT